MWGRLVGSRPFFMKIDHYDIVCVLVIFLRIHTFVNMEKLTVIKTFQMIFFLNNEKKNVCA